MLAIVSSNCSRSGRVFTCRERTRYQAGLKVRASPRPGGGITSPSGNRPSFRCRQALSDKLHSSRDFYVIPLDGWWRTLWRSAPVWRMTSSFPIRKAIKRWPTQCACDLNRQASAVGSPPAIAQVEAGGTEITRGFDNAKVMIVVCASSNRSRPVFKAVESAFGKGIVIIPIRTEEVVPSEMLEFLSAEQWLDAITPLVKTHRDRLSSIVKEYLLEQGRTEGEGKAAGAWLHRTPTLLQREAKERLESIRRKRKRKRGQTLQ